MIGWPEAIVAAVVVAAIAAIESARLSTRSEVDCEAAKASQGEQYRKLLASYESLVRDTHENEAAIRADIADIRLRVESIERMMKEVS